MKRVAIVLPPEPILLDVASAFTVFAMAGEAHYRVRVCQCAAAPLAVHGVFSLQVEADLSALAWAEIIVVPGVMGLERGFPTALLQALREARARGCRIASVCTGAFVLAEAGLLDGRRATTHWECAALLAQRYPRVEVDAEVLYIDEGDILTSAGATAGIDLCLHMIRQERGDELANWIARRLVFGPHRSGGQAQYIERPVAPSGACSLEGVRAWLLERLEQPVSVPEMAARACLSVRAFARRFQQETGSSPHQWLIAQRLDRARALLEGSDRSVQEVAALCGFGSSLSLRQHFRRQLRTSPTAYRRTFRKRATAADLETVA